MPGTSICEEVFSSQHTETQAENNHSDCSSASDMDDDANEESGENETEMVEECPEQERPDDGRPNVILKAIYFFLLFFQLKFRVPDRAVIFLLAFLKGLIWQCPP